MQSPTSKTRLSPLFSNEVEYFTLEKSYYPVPNSSVELRDVDLMKPPPADNVDPNIEAAMK